ncbi:MAG: YcgN family cysteine cluster protein [Pseudomonadota bacterium]
MSFWKKKSLEEMTSQEWEQLCDGCGKCCVNVLEDHETNELYQTNVSCFMLDTQTCHCKDYKNRKKFVPGCVKLTPKKVPEMDWLPDSCAYRRVWLGQDLPEWHHLVCNDKNRIHELGKSVQGRVISEHEIEDLEDYVIDWFD